MRRTVTVMPTMVLPERTGSRRTERSLPPTLSAFSSQAMPTGRYQYSSVPPATVWA
jgi:hypothetical protein